MPACMHVCMSACAHASRNSYVMPLPCLLEALNHDCLSILKFSCSQVFL